MLYLNLKWQFANDNPLYLTLTNVVFELKQ